MITGIIIFAAGFMIGALCGVVTTALIVVNKGED